MKNFIMAIVLVATKVWKTVPEIVAEVEKLAVDGVIDAKDRKTIAFKAVSVIADEFGIKLGWIPRIIVSVLINQVAKRLPSKDIIVPDVLKEVVKEEKKVNKNNFAKKKKK
jgi:hypothetical protein